MELEGGGGGGGEGRKGGGGGGGGCSEQVREHLEVYVISSFGIYYSRNLPFLTTLFDIKVISAVNNTTSYEIHNIMHFGAQCGQLSDDYLLTTLGKAGLPITS